MTITFKGVPCYALKFFPPRGYSAITWFNKIIVRGSAEDLNSMFDTIRGRQILNHEFIHILQGRSLGWFKFYILYLYYYFKGLFTFKSHYIAYYNIPFELEAYHNQDKDYFDTFWEDYDNYSKV